MEFRVYSFLHIKRYEGENKIDVKNGHGVLTYPDKRMYDGEWENDEKHGHTLVWNQILKYSFLIL